MKNLHAPRPDRRAHIEARRRAARIRLLRRAVERGTYVPAAGDICSAILAALTDEERVST